MKLEDVISQKVFEDEYQKAQINILVTAAWLNQQTTRDLKPFKISWQQFNILRILRGRHPEPATIKLLTERMIDQMSNASRLVEKLKQKGLVQRKACPVDRRQVDILITQKGLDLVEQASQAINQSRMEVKNNLSPKEATQLSDLLDKLRE